MAMLQVWDGSGVFVGFGDVRWLWKEEVVGGRWSVVEVVVYDGRGSFRKLGSRVMRRVAYVKDQSRVNC
jgi:hypothetical protein